MAEFCRDCCIELFGSDTKDLAGLCKKGMMVCVLCETCGYIWVDENGKKINPEDVFTWGDSERFDIGPSDLFNLQ